MDKDNFNNPDLIFGIPNRYQDLMYKVGVDLKDPFYNDSTPSQQKRIELRKKRKKRIKPKRRKK